MVLCCCRVDAVVGSVQQRSSSSGDAGVEVTVQDNSRSSDRPVVSPTGPQRALARQPASQPAGNSVDMEEGEAEAEGPLAAREGPSTEDPPTTTSTTTTLLASVKEQVGAAHLVQIVHLFLSSCVPP